MSFISLASRKNTLLCERCFFVCVALEESLFITDVQGKLHKWLVNERLSGLGRRPLRQLFNELGT